MRQEKITCFDIHNKKKDFDKKQLKFGPAVYGVLIEGGKILLSKQWDGYDFPGGKVNIDETIDDALVREFWEETGIKIKKKQIITCESSFFIHHRTGKPIHSVLIYFICKRVGGKLSKKNAAKSEKEYIGMPEWVRLKDINRIKLYNSIDSKKIIKHALEITK